MFHFKDGTKRAMTKTAHVVKFLFEPEEMNTHLYQIHTHTHTPKAVLMNKHRSRTLTRSDGFLADPSCYQVPETLDNNIRLSLSSRL